MIDKTIEERLAALEHEIAEIRRLVQPVEPFPFPVTYQRCPKCDLLLTGVIGYVCNNTDCPIGLNGI